MYCFENRGEEVGVTLHHPHGQVYAFPFVPPRTSRLLARAHAHRASTGRNLFDDLVASELADGHRVVARNKHWIAFVPRAARWPYEVMLFPATRIPDLLALGGDARAGFGPVYREVLGRLDGLFGAPMPYIAAWQQAPVRGRVARAEFAVHLQVLPVGRDPGKLSSWRGPNQRPACGPTTCFRRWRLAGCGASEGGDAAGPLVLGSQTESQRRRTPGDALRHQATISPAGWRFRRRRATSCDGWTAP